MPFPVLELIFAAVAIILLVVIAIMVRGLRRKRQAETDPPNAEPETEPFKAPEPESAERAALRRRQLTSFAEAAATEADEGATLTVLPNPPAAEAWPGDTALAETPDAPAQDEGTDFERAVLARLEAAFDALESGALALDSYIARVEAEAAAVDQRIAELSDDTDPTELDGALAARESVRWCLNWAKEQNETQ